MFDQAGSADSESADSESAEGESAEEVTLRPAITANP